MTETLLVIAGCLVYRLGLAAVGAAGGRARFAVAGAYRSLLDFAVVVLTGGLVSAVVIGVAGGGADAGVELLVLTCGLLGSGAIPLSLAERSRSRAGLLASALLIVWAGLCAASGRWGMGPMVGLALGGGGVVGLVGAGLVGARSGKFARDGSIAIIPANQLPLVLVGVLAMCAGMAMVGGGGATAGAGGGARRVLDEVYSAALGLLAAAAYSRVRFDRFDPYLLLPGALGATSAGLILAMGGVSGVGVWVCAAVAAVLALDVHLRLERKLRLDEPMGLASAQVAGAAVACVGLALLPGKAMAAGGGRWLEIALGVAAAGVLAALAWVLFSLLRRAGTLRTRESVDEDGLDLALHDVNAYPDFSQPMIRSYHLREM